LLELTHNKAVYEKIIPDLPQNAVFLNLPAFENIYTMFYTGKPAYNKKVTPELVDELRKKGYKAFVFQNQITEPIDTSVTVLPYDIKGAY